MRETATSPLTRDPGKAEVTERWFVLGHPGWPGGIDFYTQEAAEQFYWDTPKLDGTREGIRIFLRVEHRYPEYVPEAKVAGEV